MQNMNEYCTRATFGQSVAVRLAWGSYGQLVVSPDRGTLQHAQALSQSRRDHRARYAIYPGVRLGMARFMS